MRAEVAGASAPAVLSRQVPGRARVMLLAGYIALASAAFVEMGRRG
jgi:hypothetical protein